MTEVEQKGPALIDASEPISAWFGLSYAQFLTVPRIFLEAMSLEWQRRMVQCLRELDDTFDWLPQSGTFWVTLRGEDGRYLPLDSNVCDYRRGETDHLRRLPAEEEVSQTWPQTSAAPGDAGT